jgi:hypothetical protein
MIISAACLGKMENNAYVWICKLNPNTIPLLHIKRAYCVRGSQLISSGASRFQANLGWNCGKNKLLYILA